MLYNLFIEAKISLQFAQPPRCQQQFPCLHSCIPFVLGLWWWHGLSKWGGWNVLFSIWNETGIH